MASESTSRRKLAAILMADAVGYSRLMEADEAAGVAAIKASREVFRRQAEARAGRIVNAPGDSVLAEFSSVVDALAAAVEIQRELAERNAALPAGEALPFRIGINLGDVVSEADAVYGDGVNIAARLEGLAEPGGICLSRAAHEQVKGKLPLQYEDLGEHSVKNIAEPVRVYRVLSGPGATRRQAQVAAAARSPTRRGLGLGIGAVVAAALVAAEIGWWILSPGPAGPHFGPDSSSAPEASIAVLPFANMSGDPEQEYFADGITDTLITDLSKLRQLTVIARNSVFTYKGQSVDVREVGERFGVRYVLEGSVQRARDRIRLNAQLVNAETGEHVWAERFDRPLADVFTVQDEITRQIVTEMEVTLVEGEQARVWRRATDSPEAYDAFIRARAHFIRYTREDNLKAGRLLEQALALDPQFALAYAYLANKHMIDYRYGWTDFPEDSLDRGAVLAETAIALDPQLADGYSSIAYIHFIKGWDAQANAAFERALALNPNDTLTLGLYAISLMYQQRYGEALDYYQRAMRISPIPEAWAPHFIGETYRLMGRHKDAIANFNQALEIAPKYMAVRVKLICAYAAADRLDEARKEVEILLSDRPGFTVAQFQNEWAPKSTSYRDPDEIARMAGLLRRAGLP